jgi:hypothetical protein
MPGLLRGVARTAVVAGTASAVNGRVQRRQAARFAEKDAHTAAMQQEAYAQETGYGQPAPAAPAPPAPAATTADDRIVQLERLGGLYSQGVLTPEEFAAEKARILQS